jgi:hypothetical protein
MKVDVEGRDLGKRKRVSVRKDKRFKGGNWSKYATCMSAKLNILVKTLRKRNKQWYKRLIIKKK